MTQEQYGMWLCSIEGIGSQTIRKLINRFGTPEEVYTRTEEQLKEAEIGDRERKLLINGKRQFRYRAMKQKISSYDMDVISYFSERYPEKLRHIPNFPKRLYWRGKLPREELQIAIVGARNCSHYGREMARRFAYELSRAGIGIISGMARGIDGWAHQGALEAGGNTYAILGNSAEICYPREHARLYQSIVRNGGVLSEYPPETPAMPGFFPMRNRIISALSDCLVVVEAKKKSGSLITADFALEQGKDVWAVPGRLGDELSRGCLNLLKQGAGLADRPDTILEALGIQKEKIVLTQKDTKILLAKEEDIVYSWIRLQPAGLEDLIAKTGFPASRVLSVLTGLELKGLIREVQKNHYVRTDLKITDG